MGSSCAKGSNVTTQTTSPNPLAMGAYQQLLGQAFNASQQPFQTYGGEFVAPVNAQQYQGISNINGYANQAQPYIQQAYGYANQAAQPITADQISQYFNPYQQNVINTTQAQFNNTNQQALQNVKGNAIMQGALGGDREAVAEANTIGQLSLGQNKTIAGLESSGYQQALAAAQADRAAKVNAAYSIGNLGVAGENAGLAGASAMIGAGTLEQQTQQQQDAARYAQFLQQQAYPFQTTQFLAGIDTGVGSLMGGTGQTVGPPPNPFNTIAGLGLAGVGAAGGLGWKPFAAKGGRVRGFAPGGGIYGQGPTPYANAQGYVPVVQITRGQGAPRPPQPSQQQGGINPLQAYKDLRGSFGRGSDDNPNPGSAEHPLEGLSADDYAARGGRIYQAGFGTGSLMRGYDDGGGVPADWAFDPDAMTQMAPLRGGVDPDYVTPHRTSPEIYYAPADNVPVGQGVTPDDMQDWRSGVDRDVGRGEAAGSMENVPVYAGTPAGSGRAMAYGPEDEPAAGVAAINRAVREPASRYEELNARPMAGVAKSKSDSNALWQGLMAAGLGMMASKSPFLGVGIGEGGLAGLRAYSNQKQIEQEQADKKTSQAQAQQRIDQQAAQFERRMRGEEEERAETRRQHNIAAAKPFKIGTDENMRDIYAVSDNTKPAGYRVLNPSELGATTAPAPNAGADLHGEEYLATKPPERRDFIRKMANYEIDPRTLSTKGGHREQVLQEVAKFDPTYDYRNYGASATALIQFGPGRKAGDSVRSFNVGIDHLDQLHDLGIAMNNGDVQRANQLKNWVKTELGYEEPTNFNALKQIVGAEVIKAIVGAGGGVTEREAAAKLVSDASGPTQLAGVIKTLQRAMGAQLVGLKRQYETSTFRHDFEKRLSPAAQSYLKEHETGKPALNDQDSAALDWANRNPNDPRAAKIKQGLGVQ